MVSKCIYAPPPSFNVSVICIHDVIAFAKKYLLHEGDVLYKVQQRFITTVAYANIVHKS